MDTPYAQSKLTPTSAQVSATFPHYSDMDEVVRSSLQADFNLIGFSDASKRSCIALRDPTQKIYVLFADPYDRSLLNWIDAHLPHEYQIWLTDRQDIADLLLACESGAKALEDVLIPLHEDGSEKKHQETLSLANIGQDISPVIRLVNSTLYDALKSKASDIHMEATASGMVVRYRIDGVLVTVAKLDGQIRAEQIISRIKVMAELDIAERRIPQDGRFKVLVQSGQNKSIQGDAIDLRVSIMPSVHGEDAVLRILDRRDLSLHVAGLSLESLGFDDKNRTSLRRLTTAPHGMVLVTGPTGSGKTTTLYAVLTEINNGQDKVITIEDPVEYQLSGVLQIPVNERKGLTFARGLRSILRHDPDKIMVGEIRDTETAQIAVQSALTGHLVLSTVHANSALEAIDRMQQLGVDGHSLASALGGIVAQRLLRSNCPYCKSSALPSKETLADSALPLEVDENHIDKYWRYQVGAGCELCRNTGYLGRRVIAELFTLDDEMREMIAQKTSLRQLKIAARARGFRSMHEAAIELAQAGLTTLEEINRVTLVN